MYTIIRYTVYFFSFSSCRKCCCYLSDPHSSSPPMPLLPFPPSLSLSLSLSVCLSVSLHGNHRTLSLSLSLQLKYASPCCSLSFVHWPSTRVSFRTLDMQFNARVGLQHSQPLASRCCISNCPPPQTNPPESGEGGAQTPLKHWLTTSFLQPMP